MSFLEIIPYEISTEILSYLPQTELSYLSRLSRQMHAISQPLLYKSLTLTTTEKPGPSSLQNILRSLLSPGGKTLATYTRSLQVQWEDRDIYISLLCPEDLVLFTAAAEHHGLPGSLGSHPGQLELLLRLLPRLHVLTLSPPNGNTDPLAQFIAAPTASTAPTPPLCIQHLREFHCTNNPVSHTGLLTILQLPCIRTVAVHLDEDTTTSQTTNTSLPALIAAAHTSPVTSLRLTSSTLSPETLTHILTIPTALTSFSFTSRSQHPFPLTNFTHHLQPLQQALQHLHLDFTSVVYNVVSFQDSYLFRVGSFREWGSLRTLRCCLSTLLGRGKVRDGVPLVEALPLGLKELDIKGDRFWTVEEEVDVLVEYLREEAAAGMEKLAVGRLRGGLRWKDRLVVACRVAGVRLVDNGGGRGGRVADCRRRPQSYRGCCVRVRRRR